MKQEAGMNRVILLNGSETTVPSRAGMEFGAFLEELNRDLSKNSQVITQIRVSGKPLTEQEEAALRAMPFDSFGDIEILTSSPADLAYETLDTLDAYVDRLVASVRRAALLYRNGNYVAGDTYFVKAIDGLDLFVQTVGGVKIALRIGLNTKVGLAEASLVGTMNELLAAKRQSNHVYMADLLDKDLAPNLVEWKEEIFPLFRRWKTA